MNNSKKIYHYTSFENAIKIIKSEQLWLTHISYLNDKSEFIYSANFLKQIINKKEKELTNILIKKYGNDTIRKEDIDYNKRKFLVDIKLFIDLIIYNGKKIDEDYIEEGYGIETAKHFEETIKNLPKLSVFIISFSLESDDLTLWRLYSNNSKGACIEFIIDFELNKKNLILEKIEYLGELEIKERFEEILTPALEKLSDSFTSNQDISLDTVFINDYRNILVDTYKELIQIIIFSKRIGFEVEKEYRISLLCSEHENIEILSYGEKIKPIFKLLLQHNSINIKSIILGPNNEYTGNDWAINYLLKNKNIEIKKSKIDYYR